MPVHFYCMTKPENDPDAPADMDAGHLTAMMLADLLNKNPKPVSCDIHGEQEVEIGILYTYRNLELIVTKYCCEALKSEVEAALVYLKEKLNDYLTNGPDIKPVPKTKKEYISDTRMLLCIERLIQIGAVQSANEFANTVGLQRQNLVRIKKELTHFTPEHIYKACRHYNINANWVFGLESNMLRAMMPSNKTKLKNKPEKA